MRAGTTKNTLSQLRKGVFGIIFLIFPQIIDMKKIKPNPLGKSKEEREACFPAAGREEFRP